MFIRIFNMLDGFLFLQNPFRPPARKHDQKNIALTLEASSLRISIGWRSKYRAAAVSARGIRRTHAATMNGPRGQFTPSGFIQKLTG